MSLKTTVKYYNQAKNIYEDIDKEFNTMQSSTEPNFEESEFKINLLINKLKVLKKYLRYIDTNDLKEKYDEETVSNAKHNVDMFQDALYFWERFFLQAKYANDLKDPVRIKYIPDSKLSGDELEQYGGANIVNKFISTITKPDNIKDYERAIKRMVLGTMSQKEFNKIFDVLKHKMASPKKFQSLSKYKKDNE